MTLCLFYHYSLPVHSLRLQCERFYINLGIDMKEASGRNNFRIKFQRGTVLLGVLQHMLP